MIILMTKPTTEDIREMYIESVEFDAETYNDCTGDAESAGTEFDDWLYSVMLESAYTTTTGTAKGLQEALDLMAPMLDPSVIRGAQAMIDSVRGTARSLKEAV